MFVNVELIFWYVCVHFAMSVVCVTVAWKITPSFSQLSSSLHWRLLSMTLTFGLCMHAESPMAGGDAAVSEQKGWFCLRSSAVHKTLRAKCPIFPLPDKKLTVVLCFVNCALLVADLSKIWHSYALWWKCHITKSYTFVLSKVLPSLIFFSCTTKQLFICFSNISDMSLCFDTVIFLAERWRISMRMIRMVFKAPVIQMLGIFFSEIPQHSVVQQTKPVMLNLDFICYVLIFVLVEKREKKTTTTNQPILLLKISLSIDCLNTWSNHLIELPTYMTDEVNAKYALSAQICLHTNLSASLQRHTKSGHWLVSFFA